MVLRGRHSSAGTAHGQTGLTLTHPLARRPKPERRRRARAAFTLIELLVVIAIMGILVAMVVSVGSSIRQRQHERIARQDVNMLRSQVASHFETYGAYPSEWTDVDDPDTGWDRSWAEDVKRQKAALNCGWLLKQLERDQGLRRVIRDAFSSDRFKQDSNADIDHDGDQESFTYLVDGFEFKERRAFNYLREGGAGGTPLIYSAGADGEYDTSDDVRSDETENP